MDIADIATPEYSEVGVEEQVGKVRALFDDGNPKALIVTGDDGYEGIVTQKRLIGSHIDDGTKVSAVMRPAPRVRRHEDVRDVARMLVEGGVTAAPVFEGDSLWGIVAQDAILEAVLDSLDALSIADVYTEDVVTIGEDDDLGRVINLLRENGISRLPVVNDNGYLAGVVTTYDIVDFVTRNVRRATTGDRAGDNERMLDLPVYDVMSTPVATTTPGASAQEAVETMLENDYAGLVVTPPEDDRIVEGIITKTDILRALAITEEHHLDVQITNIDLLDVLSREEIRQSIEEVADKYQDMQVQHAHVRFHKHKEQLRGTPLIQAQIRLRTNRGQVAGSGEGYGAESAFYVAVDTLE
ncbi:MAG: CBS domain-containing protein, partial [Halobacteriales archaeon]